MDLEWHTQKSSILSHVLFLIMLAWWLLRGKHSLFMRMAPWFFTWGRFWGKYGAGHFSTPAIVRFSIEGAAAALAGFLLCVFADGGPHRARRASLTQHGLCRGFCRNTSVLIAEPLWLSALAFRKHGCCHESKMHNTAEDKLHNKRRKLFNMSWYHQGGDENIIQTTEQETWTLKP